MSTDTGRKLKEVQTVVLWHFLDLEYWIGKVCVAQQLSALEHSPVVQGDLAAPGAPSWIRGSLFSPGMVTCIQTLPGNSVLKMFPL